MVDSVKLLYKNNNELTNFFGVVHGEIRKF